MIKSVTSPRTFGGLRYSYHETYWTKKMATAAKTRMIRKGYKCRVTHGKTTGYRVYIRKT